MKTHTPKNRKAQVTVFIILGVIIVLGSAALLLLRRGVGEAEIEQAAEEVPLEAKPIQEFVTSCLYDKTKEAFIILGQHGGYIDMTDAELSGETFALDPTEPTESDAAFLTQNENSHVAYWWQMKTPNDCNNCLVTDQGRPSIEQIQDQVDKYVERHIKECTAGFSAFESRGFDIKESDKITATTRIADDDISILLLHEINATLEGRSTQMTRFFTRLNLRFKDIYNFASKVAEAEMNTSFLEQPVKHVVSVSGGARIDALPPISYQENSYVPLTWSKALVKLNLQSLLASHVPLIQMNRTRNFRPPTFSDDPLIQNLYAPFLINALQEDHLNYSARFFYMNWPYYLEITPSERELIKPSRTTHVNRGLGPFKVPYSFMPGYLYEYFYDISFPVVVEIKSYDELFNETYTFLIALEVNVRDNRDLREWFNGEGTIGPMTEPYAALRSSGAVAETLEGEDIPKEEIQSMPLVSGNYTKTLFCNTKQRISGNVTIIVKDKTNASLIEGAEISYSCGTYQTCRMGRTEKDPETGETLFRSQFPVCKGGGILGVEKDGYFESATPGLSTLPGEEQELEIKIDRIRTKNVSVKKYVLNRELYNDSLYKEHKTMTWNSTLRPLEPADMVMITFRKIPEAPMEPTFSKFIIFYGNDTKNKDVFRTVDFVPGEYALEIQHFDTNRTVMPKKCHHECDECSSDYCEKECRLDPEDYTAKCDRGWRSAVAGIVTAGVEDCVPCGECDVDFWMPEDNDTVIDINVLGGFSINETTPWVVTTYDLDSGGRFVEFRFVQTQRPRCVPDIEEMQEVTEFYETGRRFMVPIFKQETT